MSSHASTRNVLDKFLKDREGEWWTPHEIKKELGGDIRTIIDGIRSLSRRPVETTYKGWRLEMAERARIYCVRMKRDMENLGKLVKAEVSDVEGKRICPQISSKKHTLDPYLEYDSCALAILRRGLLL